MYAKKIPTTKDSFYEHIYADVTIEEKFDLLAKLCAEFGFPDILYARSMPTLLSSERPVNSDGRFDGMEHNVIVYRRWNPEWEAIYQAERFQYVNWIWDEAQRCNGPMKFGPLPNMTAAQKKFFDLATEYRQMNGFAIPMKGPGRTVAGLSVAGGEDTPSEYQIAQISAAAYMFHVVIGAQIVDDNVDEMNITERDIQRMNWLVRNCTLRDIAEFEGTDYAAVRKGMQLLRQKMGVSETPALIYKAMKLNLID